METTTSKRGRKPSITKTAEEPKTNSFKIKRSEKKVTTKEYRCIRGGATLMLRSSGAVIFDEDLGYNREIRYCAAEPSIYVDEQSPSAVKTPVFFRLGVLFANEKQRNLQEYLDKHPGNRKNGGEKFYEVESNKVRVEKNIKSEFAVMDAIGILREKPLDDLLAVAISFNIDIDRSVDEIKYDLLQKAKRSPKSFIDAFDNPVVQMKAKIKQAASLNIIKLNDDSVKWFDTNKLIVSVPAGMDPMDVFVRYCLTEAAAPTVAEMERQLQS